MVDILLVEDDLKHVGPVQQALELVRAPTSLSVVHDGLDALAFLRREGTFVDAPTPALIVLDLNMPQLGGIEVLRELDTTPDLRRIPVIVYSASTSVQDLHEVYALGGNCFIPKPSDATVHVAVLVRALEFWTSTARLPADAERPSEDRE